MTPVFFSEKVAEALSGETIHDRLSDLAALIHEATAAKEAGSGPPIEDLNIARRKWLDLYESVYGWGTQRPVIPDEEIAA